MLGIFLYFKGYDDYKNFLVFAPILSSLIFDSNKKVTDWISTGLLPVKIKLFDISLELIMSNLSNGRANLEFKNSALV